jgi:hypothetical protein
MVVPTTSPPVFFESPKNLKVHDKNVRKLRQLAERGDGDGGGAERKRAERLRLGGLRRESKIIMHAESQRRLIAIRILEE